jgi:hypothetical protein
MQCRPWFLYGLWIGAAAIFGVSPAVKAEVGKLEPVRLEQPEPGKPVSAEFRRYFSRAPQYFQMGLAKDAPGSAGEEDFNSVIKKEPEKYIVERPLRGVAKLGSKKYGFALDKKSGESKSFDRLYFDLNCNGDLTDDRPIDAISPEPPKEDGKGEKAEKNKAKVTRRPALVRSGSPVVRFPRVDMTLEADGKSYEYSFFLNVYAQFSGDHPVASASLSPAVYYKGEITLEGKTLPIALVDNNSNGRFDDEIKFREAGSKGQLAPEYGDALLVDPETTPAIEIYINRGSTAHRQWLAKINQIEGKYYDLKASPSGGSVTCTPYTAALGKIASPQAFSDLKLIGKQGFLTLRLEKAQPIEVPAGEWRMSSYVIQVDDWKPPEAEKKEAEEKDKKAEAVDPNNLLLAALKKATGPSTVTAYGTGNEEAIRVEAGRTADLKIGPPYKILLTHVSKPGTVDFSLALRGADGERVGGLTVNGKQPSPPKLTVSDPKGETIHEGKFRFG